jgi:hypothetical protein
MPKQRKNQSYRVEYLVTRPDGVMKQYEVDNDSSYADSPTKRLGEMFNVGGGSTYKDWSAIGEYQLDYGSHVFEPLQDFTGWVQLWGAGGGGYHTDSGGIAAGGGGFTQALVRFKANIPYTIMIGQGGQHGDATSHGGGGRGHSGGGQGGGLTGIFYNTRLTSKTRPSHHAPPVSQANALVIAGGGGGKGHHNQANHGGGGGGGGWTGRSGHNTGAGSQTSGGSGGYNNDGVNGGRGSALHGGHSYSNSWNGGGGGGWFGGGGGGHTGNHYNGGAGGSGHHAYPSSVASQPNNALSEFIVTAHTARAPGSHDNNFTVPAMAGNPYNSAGEQGAGYGGRGNYNSWDESNQASNGKAIITLAHPIFNNPTFNFPTHTSVENQDGWTQSY